LPTAEKLIDGFCQPLTEPQISQDRQREAIVQVQSKIIHRREAKTLQK